MVASCSRALEPLATLEEPQTLEVLVEALERRGLHGVTSPAPLAASYRVRSRTLDGGPELAGITRRRGEGRGALPRDPRDRARPMLGQDPQLMLARGLGMRRHPLALMADLASPESRLHAGASAL